MLVDVAILALFRISHDAASHRSGNLPTENIRAVGRRNQHVGPLVFLARLRQPRLVEIAVEMVNRLHLPIHRKPVGVDIEKAHENRNHQPSVVEIFRFLDFLDDNDLSVGRRDNDSLRVFLRKIANRTAEEIDDNGVCRTENHDEQPEPNLRVEPPQQQRHGSNHDEAPDERVVSFTVYSDFL